MTGEEKTTIITVLKRQIDTNEKVIIENADLSHEEVEKINTESSICAKAINTLNESISMSGMNINDYQKFAAKGIRKESEGKNLIVGFALGLGGEAGEVLDDIKKREYHGRNISIEHTAEELGDVMWYVSNVATQLGFSLEDILEFNVHKLKNRYPDLYKEE